MQIYTSYFPAVRKMNTDTIVPIAICIKPPAGWKGLVYTKLAPNYSILMDYKSNPDTVIYTERFNNEILSKLNMNDVINELSALSGGKDVALLCYEKPSDFCHRHLVAEHIKKTMNIDVKEWQA